MFCYFSENASNNVNYKSEWNVWQYYHQYFMKSTVIIFALLLCLVQSPPDRFCSTICKTNNCNGITSNDCDKCNNNWVRSGSTCLADSNNNWRIFSTTPNLASGTLISSIVSTVTCGSYVMYGRVPVNSILTISTPAAGITVDYFSIAVYAAVMAFDAGGSMGSNSIWQSRSSDFYTLTFSDGTITPIVSNYKLESPYIKKNYCQLSRSEYGDQLEQSYTYGTKNIQLKWAITLNDTNSANGWALYDFAIIIRSCDWRCVACTGSSNTQCSSCLDNGTHIMWLSGNTCDTACRSSNPSYGATSTGNVCILCDVLCRICFDSPTNCSACTTFGVNIAFFYVDPLNPSIMTCLQTCPTGYFANRTGNTCDPCSLNCTACLNRATYCTSCIATFGWTGWACYNPCPYRYFMDPSLPSNCSVCSPYCQVCVGPNTLCTECTLTGTSRAFLHNTTDNTGSCLINCPPSYYAQSFSGAGPNLCLACDISCTVCTGSPHPCSICATGFFLLNSTYCVSPCPNNTFSSNVSGSGVCYYCSDSCAKLSISMYFPNSLKKMIYVDMLFNQDLNYASFDQQTFQTFAVSSSSDFSYSLGMFNFEYKNLSSKSYRITITPKGYIFLYNATFTVTTMIQPTPVHYAATSMPFASENYELSAQVEWFLISGPPYSDLQQGIITSFSTLSSHVNRIMATPYLQEIKKSGVFNLLMGGAQITSTAMLSNQIQPQNLYQGTRFWASFVYFDAPQYQMISNKTKRFVDPSVQSQIRDAQAVGHQRQIKNNPRPQGRRLFSTNSMYWRFQRVGQTSFFIYDVYVPVVLIMICWILLIVAHKCRHARWYQRYASKVFSVTHKIHEISIFYVTMAAIVEYIYFEPTSAQRFISAGICALFNIYFVLYELYIYYDMLKYPLAQIGNKRFEYYAIRYGCFLKNVRFEEYDIQQPWSPKHWFRPYNYHLLSYYKKFVMVITLPLFYDTTYAQMAILVLIQILQLIRFIWTWPFLSRRRNWLRLSLQISLLLFFLANLIEVGVINTIMKSEPSELGNKILIFNTLGWMGFAFCFYFNIMHVIICVYDLCVGLRVGNKQKMQNARRKYYYDKIEEYEKGNESSSKQLVNRWVKLGNLNHRATGELPQINVRIQHYKITKIDSRLEVQVRKITDLKMKAKKNYRKQNNTTAGSKIQITLSLFQAQNPTLYGIFNRFYRDYSSPHVQTVVLKTFLNVVQKDYEEGQNIPFYRNNMFQKVLLLSYDYDQEQRNIEELIPGFPIDPSLLKQ